MHICTQPKWKCFQIQACGTLHDLYTGNTRFGVNLVLGRKVHIHGEHCSNNLNGTAM
jgi:hypothetical protein